MKLNELHLLAESDDAELERLELVDVLNKVKDDCQQYLRRMASNGKFHALYVGQAERWPKIEVQVRKDKAPVPTPKRIQDAFDRVMVELYQKEFRSDSFYASGDPERAAKRGIKHIIFPIGRFDYLWSEKVKDLIHGFGTEEDLVDDEGLYFDIQDAEDESAEDKVVKEFLKSKEFKLSQELKACADKGNDVMIDCKYYYAIPAKLIDTHYDTFKKMVGELHFDQSRKSDLT